MRSPNLSEEPSIAALVREQARVVYALMIREIYTRFGRENIGFAWIVAEPVAFASAVVVLWSVMPHAGHAEIPIVPFVITGYMPLLMYRHMLGRAMRCMQANTSLLYHRQVTVFSLYVSRILVEILGATAAFMFCMVMFSMLGMVNMPDSVPTMIGGWLLYAWYAAATAFAVGALSERTEVVERFWNPFSYITIPLSGTFYMLYWFPDSLRQYMLWSPPINGVEMIRGGYFGADIPTFYDPAYFALVNAVVTMIGLWLVKDARQYVEVE